MYRDATLSTLRTPSAPLCRYLKQLRRNRDEEAHLMRDVPGWKVGQLYDLPVYDHPNRGLTDPEICEFYAHADPKFLWERLEYGMYK